MTWRSMALAVATCALGAPCKAQENLEIIFEGRVSEAVMLDGSAVAVAEDDQVHIISLSRGRRVALDGPFAKVENIVRSPDGGLVVWDDSLYAAFVFDVDGKERRVVTFPTRGIVSGEVDFVALLAGDVGLFGEVVLGNPFAISPGPYRNPVQYATITTDGTRNVLWEALGKERIIHKGEQGTASAPVIFGNQVFARPVDGERFVVAQTEEVEAIVLSLDGTRSGTVPMPSVGSAISQYQVEQERARLIAAYTPGPLEEMLRELLPEAQAKERMAKLTAGAMEALRAAPANRAPPRISDLRVDSNGRVWMRRFVPPGDTLAVWEIRSVDGGGHRTMELPTNWVLYDATATRILVGVRAADGLVTRVVLVDRSS